MIHGALYQANAWGPAAQQMVQIYDTLVAAANTSHSILESRSQNAAHLLLESLASSRRHFSPVSPPNAERKRVIGLDKRAAAPQFDFATSTVAIACSDGIDTPHVTTRDVFGELVFAAETSSQLIGAEWFATQYCHRYVSSCFFSLRSFESPVVGMMLNSLLIVRSIFSV